MPFFVTSPTDNKRDEQLTVTSIPVDNVDNRKLLGIHCTYSVIRTRGRGMNHFELSLIVINIPNHNMIISHCRLPNSRVEHLGRSYVTDIIVSR